MKIKLNIIISLLLLYLSPPPIFAATKTVETDTSTATITTKVEATFSSQTTPTLSFHSQRSALQWLTSKVNPIFGKDNSPSLVITDPKGKILVNNQLSLTQTSMSLDQQKLTPGSYSVSIDDQIVTNFAWGVLAINTNQSIYSPNQTAKLELAVLDETGNMVCDADVVLIITDPKGNKTLLQTADNSITVSDTCHQKIFTLDPDFAASYKVLYPGTYTMDLVSTTKNGTYQIRDTFTAQNNLPFSVQRLTATRIYPVNPYPMTFHIDFNQPFSGVITEKIPASFQITDIGQNGKVINLPDGGYLISWPVTATTGQTIDLSYQYKAPEISPYWYTLGPMTMVEKNLTIFQESRSWQIASDAISLVQQKTAANPDGSPNYGITVTFDSAATAGNLIVSGVAVNKSSGTITVPSGFTLVHKVESGGASTGAMAYKIATGGETSIAWSWGSNTEGSAWIGEFSGLVTSNVLDVSAENETYINTQVSSLSTNTTATTAQNDELAIAMYMADAAFGGERSETNPSWTNGFSTIAEITALPDGYTSYLNVATKTLSTTGTVESTFSRYNIDECYAVIATFKMASGTTRPTTSSSFQRKTWYDGTRYWRSSLDTTNSRIIFEYSTNGSSWTENTSARIAVDTQDFSIEADSTNLFVVYTNGYDVESRSASSYPSTSFGWGDATTVFDGSSLTDVYYYPTLVRDTNNKIWAASTHHSGSNYIFTTTQSTNANDISTWQPANAANISINANQYGLLSPLSSGGMYAIWIDGTDIEGAQYSGGVGSTLTVAVATTADDGYRYSDNSFTTTSNYNRAGSYNDGSNRDYHTFTRFTGITISGTITTAYMTVYGESTTGSPTVKVYAVNADNPSAPTTDQEFNFMPLTKTGIGWTGTWSGNFYQSPSLTTLIQELVNNHTINNDAIILQIRDIGSTGNNYYQITDYTGNSSRAATLHIEYNLGWGTPVSIGTGITSITANMSATSDSSQNIHLTYIDSSNNTIYREYTSSWQTAVTLDSNSGNEYPSISYNTSNNNLYAFWIRNNHIFYKKGVSPYASGNWDATAIDWQTTGTNVYLTSNYSGSNQIFTEWYDGSAIDWDLVDIGPTPTPTPTPPPGDFRMEGIKIDGIKID